MKRLLLLAVLVLIWLPIVRAVNTTLYQGVYQFEDYAASGMTWSGTWTTASNFGPWVVRVSTDTAAYVTLDVAGDFLVVYHEIFSSDTAGTYQICHGDGTNCVSYSLGDASAVLELQFADTYPLPGRGTVQTIKINVDSTTALRLDYLMVLNVGPDFSATPPNTPVPTATILPSSTPGGPTATILPSSTPANTPVDTATAVPTATPPDPPVPTATILPSSTPGVPTATILPSSTPANTPVDTPTEITFLATPTEVDVSLILTLIAGLTPSTPVPTDTPTISPTPTPDPCVYATVESGQLTSFCYVATGSDVHTGNLLTLIFFSVWGFFLFTVFVLVRYKK